MSLDRNGEFNAVALRPNAIFAANAASTGVDITDYEGVLKANLDVSALTAGDNDSTYTASFEHSDELSANYTAIGTNVTVANIANFQSVGIDTRAVKKYIRVQSNLTGANSPSRSVSIVAFGKKKLV